MSEIDISIILKMLESNSHHFSYLNIGEILGGECENDTNLLL